MDTEIADVAGKCVDSRGDHGTADFVAVPDERLRPDRCRVDHRPGSEIGWQRGGLDFGELSTGRATARTGSKKAGLVPAAVVDTQDRHPGVAG
ncbi:hypothetical protein [Rhodococcus globerulus]|uniref:Uncharacterized protein n=1 Tax=Rhodococcus globerulus TaxID=33008 RepID=A0ABU4C2Y1_RHOGO|nr:hypothetical protein [Rhodococcus globerulus]MDV6270853.1 hypothetical protein [Rhodococcus globerulus]